MYEDLGEVKLKTGETVRVGAVLAPDADWRERIEKLLWHKGGIWNWQNQTLLSGAAGLYVSRPADLGTPAQSAEREVQSGADVGKTDTGVEARYYVLHRDGVPFANVLVSRIGAAATFGHVWTEPEDRRKGAMSRLIDRAMEHFRARGGKALFLGTGFDSVPYHLYENHGFRGIEPESGYMAYYNGSKGQFEAEYFAPGDTVIESVGWPHWPSSVALFTGEFPGVVRCTPLGIVGRASTEKPILFPLREAAHEAEKGRAHTPRAVVSRLEGSGAVTGLAVWGWDALWPGTCLVDVYCHPDHWRNAGQLLSALRPPPAGRCVAYADSTCEPKHEALREAGFSPGAKLEGWVPADAAKTRTVDVQVYRLPARTT